MYSRVSTRNNRHGRTTEILVMEGNVIALSCPVYTRNGSSKAVGGQLYRMRKRGYLD